MMHVPYFGLDLASKKKKLGFDPGTCLATHLHARSSRCGAVLYRPLYARLEVPKGMETGCKENLVSDLSRFSPSSGQLVGVSLAAARR